MLRTPERDKHIVNVSAVEGQFYRRFKTTRHPHTNMAKAALNMMTRTSAADYHADGIHMNSVDTGWVSDEDPVAHRRAEERRAPVPPAARHRRRRRPHRRPDHRRLQHRHPRVGPVPEGLPPDRLVRVPSAGVSRRSSGGHTAWPRRSSATETAWSMLMAKWSGCLDRLGPGCRPRSRPRATARRSGPARRADRAAPGSGGAAGRRRGEPAVAGERSRMGPCPDVAPPDRGIAPGQPGER